MEKVFFKNIESVIISELQNAQESIFVAMSWFSNRHIFDVLLQKAGQGVATHLILLDDYLNKRKEGLPLHELISVGSKLYFSDKTAPIHHKFCIIDNATLLTGSYNWTYFSESKALENILLVKDNQEVVSSFLREFELVASVLSPVSEVVPYTMAEGLVNENFGLKHYLSEDVYLQALKAGEEGDDIASLALMHHSAQIDEYKTEAQSEFIKEKQKAINLQEEIEEEVEEENVIIYPQESFTSRGLGNITGENNEEQIQENQVIELSQEQITYQENNPTEQEMSYESQSQAENSASENQTSIENPIIGATESIDNQITENTTNGAINEVSLPVFNAEAEAFIQQGESAYQQNKYDEAAQFFMQAVNIQVDNAKAYLNLAIVKWRQGNFYEQAEFASQSIQYDPANSKAYNTLGLAQDKLKNFAEAVNNYTKALEINPDNYSYLWNRGLALKMIGRRQEALLDMSKVVKLCNQVIMSQPNNQNAKQTLGMAMREMGT